ncbi:hypothetical protein [Hydrogenophaga palleronii]|uniref:hypothetical protein n=1 Tax=Hydrogenophaga palleronii TaxID=65655 RepID=UPI000826EBBF|nr:hypothetical protein [Hydrogenophaga palleronii]
MSHFNHAGFPSSHLLGPAAAASVDALLPVGVRAQAVRAGDWSDNPLRMFDGCSTQLCDIAAMLDGATQAHCFSEPGGAGPGLMGNVMGSQERQALAFGTTPRRPSEGARGR